MASTAFIVLSMVIQLIELESYLNNYYYKVNLHIYHFLLCNQQLGYCYKIDIFGVWDYPQFLGYFWLFHECNWFELFHLHIYRKIYVNGLITKKGTTLGKFENIIILLADVAILLANLILMYVFLLRRSIFILV